MVTHNAELHRRGWLSAALLSIVVPLALMSAYLLLSRVAVPSVKGDADFIAVFVSAVAGAVTLWRPLYPRVFKVLFSVAYLPAVAMLLVLYGFTVDCALFHDCD